MTAQPIRILEKYWKPGTNKVILLGIFLTLLFFGAFFYVYVSENYSYLVERNFRLLATWSKELTETFDNYERSFRFRVQEQESAGLADPSTAIQSRGVHADNPELTALSQKGLIRLTPDLQMMNESFR